MRTPMSSMPTPSARSANITASLSKEAAATLTAATDPSNPHPPSPAGLVPPSPAVRERSFELNACSPSPALRERGASAARRVRVLRPYRESADGDLDRRRRDHRALDLLFVERGACALCFLRRKVEETRAVDVLLAALRGLHDLHRLSSGSGDNGGGTHRLLGCTLDAERTELDAPAIGSDWRRLRLGNGREVGGDLAGGFGQLSNFFARADRFGLVRLGHRWCRGRRRRFAPRHQGAAGPYVGEALIEETSP